MKFIENLPLFLLRPLAKAVGNPSMARHILALRYRRWTGRTIDWNHPANLQEYILAQLMDAAADPARLELYATLADKVAVRRYAATRARAAHPSPCWAHGDALRKSAGKASRRNSR